MPQPADFEPQELVGPAIRVWREINDTMTVGVTNKLAIELRPALSVDLVLDGLADVEVRAEPKRLGENVARPIAHALADVVARDDKALAIVGNAANEDVNVRMFGVPVIDGYPVEPRAEVALHVDHQVTSEVLEVAELHCILRRNDETEVMPIILAAVAEGVMICIFGVGTEHPRLLTITCNTFAAKIFEMGGEWRRPSELPYHTGLDDGAA
ncbi:hypothetical protein X772_01520 [Mesorhizobium sp. LSJC280B00]|nr:hypothetical protein X772_01520 [Mesorhizobium sp. LSJC280B00]